MKTRTGGRKVLFGSNFPMIGQSHCLADLEQLGLSPQGRSDYLAGNAQRALPKLEVWPA